MTEEEIKTETSISVEEFNLLKNQFEALNEALNLKIDELKSELEEEKKKIVKLDNFAKSCDYDIYKAQN